MTKVEKDIAKAERLKEAFRHAYIGYGIETQGAFADRIGVKRTAISAAMNGNKSYLTKNMFIKICAAFPGVFNISYFLTGEGTLLASQSASDMSEGIAADSAPVRPVQSYTKGRPYYNVDFALGFLCLENDQTTRPDCYVDFPPYNDCDCWCNAYGDSMHPTISSGDAVALKRIHDLRYLINGQIYAIVTTNGLRTIKRIRDNGDSITLIADNTTIPEQTIPKSIVTHAYIVRASFKLF